MLIGLHTFNKSREDDFNHDLPVKQIQLEYTDRSEISRDTDFTEGSIEYEIPTSMLSYVGAFEDSIHFQMKGDIMASFSIYF